VYIAPRMGCSPLTGGDFRSTLHPSLHPSVRPYKHRGTCETRRTIGNGTFSLILYILFLLVCLFLSHVWLEMTKKIKRKVTEEPFYKSVCIKVVRLSQVKLLTGFQWNFTEVINTIPTCAHCWHVLFNCTIWLPKLKIEISCLAWFQWNFTGRF
jgi:hypothetical protein